MALDKEIWIADIQENLFQGNAHLNYAIDDTQFIDNKTIHIPQAGSNPAVAVNRGTVPATIGQRVDSDFTYNIDEYTTDPILIRDLDDEAFLSYDKRQSVMSQHMDVLRNTLGNQSLFNWADSVNVASGYLVRTTGTATASALAPGATGNRKAINKNDVIALKKVLAKQDVPMDDGRLWLGLPSDLYFQLLEIETNISRANEFGQATLPEGAVNRIMGFNVYIRPRINVYDNSAVIKAIGAATATSDNLGALAWHSGMVSKAMGGINVMTDFGDGGNGKPEYYGGIISAEVYFGSEKRRADNKGLAVLVQDAE